MSPENARQSGMGPDGGSEFLSALRRDAAAWAAEGLLRQRRVLDSAAGAWIEVAGQGRRLSFLSNDYLGLAAEPILRRAVAEGAACWGTGSGASALISGHMRCHAEAEAALRDFVGAPAALLFITGYMANLAVIASLMQGPDDVIFSDALNHASLIDGCRLSRARVVRFPHLDYRALATLLQETPARHRLIVSDGVFSMDGDIADVTALLRLAEQHDALLMVDDAHGWGVLGPDGRGTVAASGVASERLIQVGTLGKAAGLSGAFVAASRLLIDHLVQRGRTYVFSTSPSPALVAAIPAALRLVAEGAWRREQLAILRERLTRGAVAWRRRPIDGGTPILPVLVGGALEAVELGARLAEQGVLVASIRPPTVARGTARLRISLSALHSVNDVDLLLAGAECLGV